ncbi:hypothetical protein Acsp04_61560 [Actinomadura sp. NBRC 104425]|uniref:hypothetical protein n=1 Tax=Actinomadura sp. NBRC 104425 TaxID=3032204 RepID=UPI0024A1577E|nr:hypothetical protein [Actinomadura sp. NBRC 104425]GLZ15921.1 hypothetical protein Acsp04_61560 [Actinomadura sp. NBRC 104425]
MVDINRPWVGDTELSTRFPVYTRGNTGEVAGRVASPLSWSAIGGVPAEVQWRKALAEFGAFDEGEFRTGEIDTMGLIHGYIYMNLSVQRVFGARMPGATPELGRHADHRRRHRRNGHRPLSPSPTVTQ